MNERPRYPAGAFCWVGLATSDPGRAKAFYADLFGWRGEDHHAPGVGLFTMLHLGRKNVAILYRQTPEARAARATPHWTPFIAVNDADAMTAWAETLGGAALRESVDVLDAGRVATLRDPAGAIAALWEARAVAGADLLDHSRALGWTELTTDDVQAAARFYGGLFGWRYSRDGFSLRIETAGGANGTIRGRRGGDDDRTQSSWTPYFLVESTDAAVERAEQAGGRVLPSGDASPVPRRATRIVDPMGAEFGVFMRPV